MRFLLRRLVLLLGGQRRYEERRDDATVIAQRRIELERAAFAARDTRASIEGRWRLAMRHHAMARWQQVQRLAHCERRWREIRGPVRAAKPIPPHVLPIRRAS